MVAKAHTEIKLLRAEVKTQEGKSGEKNIHTALARYNLGRALWLSNEPHETALAVKEFASIISFTTKREPNHLLLGEFKKIRDMALKTIQNLFGFTGIRNWVFSCPKWMV